MPVKETAVRQDPEKTHDSEGPLDVQPVSSAGATKYAEDLAFMEEYVEVMVAPSPGQDDTTRLVGPVSVNGIGQYFIRGEWVKCKRKFLGALLRARQESWTFGYKRTPDGQTRDTQAAIQNARFPLSGVRDQNPKGAAWLQAKQQERI